jgi:uncharacterized protein YbbC (DUF1343 family)
MSASDVILGIDRLLSEAFDLVDGKRVGLVTNSSGVNRQLESSASLLQRAKGVKLRMLFGPEHGLRASAPDGERVASDTDPETGLPVYSLYDGDRRPAEAVLRQLDLLLFDLQDVGARFYTYLYTMSHCMEVCAGVDLPFAVLDRPNPIGGEKIEGNLLDPAFASFVGRYRIPIRFGLTIGETARLFNQEFGIGANLQVVEVEGWRRNRYWDQCGLLWVPPSPNMPTPDTAVVYPGMCLFEGTNLSEGRGTSKPFEQVGAPYVESHRLVKRLRELELPGVRWRPVHFRPEFGKHVGSECHGAQLHVFDRDAFCPVRTGLELLVAIKELWPADFEWRLPASGIHNFDRLMGTDQVRADIDAGMQVSQLVATWQTDCDRFRSFCEPYRIYR